MTEKKAVQARMPLISNPLPYRGVIFRAGEIFEPSAFSSARVFRGPRVHIRQGLSWEGSRNPIQPPPHTMREEQHGNFSKSGVCLLGP